MAEQQTDLEEAVSALVRVARKEVDRTITRITVDPQESGEVPFQLFIPDETLPQAGLARISGDDGRPTRKQQSGAGNQTRNPS